MKYFFILMQDFLELRKYSYERLDGSIRAEERFAAIRSFSSSSANMGLNSEADQNGAFVFMISTRAGGVGLNLVAADTVSAVKLSTFFKFEADNWFIFLHYYYYFLNVGIYKMMILSEVSILFN